MVLIKNLNKKFSDRIILKDLSLELPDTGSICIFGKTGIGKTTLLNIIAGVTKADSGEIIGIQNKKTSYVFQDDRLLPWLTIRKNLLLLNNIDNNILEEYLNFFELKDSENKLISEISGGMKRKVDIIKALLYDGEIFILDEPFNGIDELSKQKIINLLLEKSKDKLIIVVTHDSDDASKFGSVLQL